MADIFTKNLDYSTTLRRVKSLGFQEVGIAAVSCELGCLLSLLGCACVGRHHVSLEDRYCSMSFAKWLVVEFLRSRHLFHVRGIKEF